MILLHYPWKYTSTLKNSKIPIIAFIHDDFVGKSCGVPLVVLTDESGLHASDEIVADKSHSIKIVKTKNCKEQVINAIEVLSQYSTEKRLEIANMTREKHSLEAWKRMFCDMFDNRMSSCTKPTQSLLKFASH